MRLKNRKAIITGGSRGIGAEIVRRLSSEGAQIGIADLDNSDEIIAEIEKNGGTACAIKIDLTESGACERTINELSRQMGGLDILVNNAGLFMDVPFEDLTEEIWTTHHEILARIPVFLCKAALPQLKSSSAGRVINVTSTSAHFGSPSTVSYSAAKGALLAASRSLMTELGPLGISVNTVAPGLIKTRLNDALRSIEGHEERWSQLVPSGQGLLDPKAIAGAVAFLASDDGSMIHGQDIIVDGGFTAGLSSGAFNHAG